MSYKPPVNVGQSDGDLYFCTAQAIPLDGADDISENRINTGIVAPLLARGKKLKLKVEVTTLIAVASGTASQLRVNLITDDSGTTTIGAHATVATALVTLGYNDAKGTIYEAVLPPSPKTAYQQYLALALEPVNDDTLYSAGAIDAWIAVE